VVIVGFCAGWHDAPSNAAVIPIADDLGVTMKLEFWLLLALAGSVSCADNPEKDGTSGSPADEQSGSPEDGPAGAGSSKSTPSPSKKEESSKAGSPKKGAASGGGASGGSTTSGDLCKGISFAARPGDAEFLIVLDRSSSMIGVGLGGLIGGLDRWTPATTAVKNFVGSLQAKAKFGLMLFPDPAIPVPFSCEKGKIDVQPAVNSAAQIERVLTMSPPGDLLAAGSTPTASSLLAALAAFRAPPCGADCTDITSKHVLLVTDGDPTCPSRGRTPQEETIEAVDALLAAGIDTYVIGYGSDLGGDFMNELARHGGTEKFYPVDDEATLNAHLAKIAGGVVDCEYTLDHDITVPENVSVQIDAIDYVQGKDWHIEGRKIILDPDAPACQRVRDNLTVHNVEIKQQCEPVILK
jgi:hypothetical protein